MEFTAQAHLLNKNKLSFFLSSVAGDLLTTQNILTSHLWRVAAHPTARPFTVTSPKERNTQCAPSVFLWDKPKPGLVPSPESNKENPPVKAIKCVKKIQKLFSPFDCYLLVTTFVKNITSVFGKRSFSSYNNMEK